MTDPGTAAHLTPEPGPWPGPWPCWVIGDRSGKVLSRIEQVGRPTRLACWIAVGAAIRFWRDHRGLWGKEARVMPLDMRPDALIQVLRRNRVRSVVRCD
jgi:hypothetical protein